MRLNEDTVFKNKAFSNELKENGVVQIPFLSDTELSELNKFYDSMHPSGEPPTLYDGIHMTIWHSDLEYKLKIRDGIKSIVSAAFERNFENYRAISQQFIVKKQGSETTFPIHQDWSIVDEEKYFSLNIWIPLHDVDEKNGAMWIVKKSHKLGNTIRGAGILFPNYHPYLEALKPYMTSFSMKAGEALIFYHSTIHGSPFNNSENLRKVIQCTLLPLNAPKQVYFQKDINSPLEIHHPIDDFSFHYDNIRSDSESIRPSKKASAIFNNFSFKTPDINLITENIFQTHHE
jgi:hypothetical protein